MSPKSARFGLVVALSLVAGQPAVAQYAANAANQGGDRAEKPVKPTGPAAKKADDLIRGYTTRIEKEIEQERKELERLRTELHELIDVRFEMAAAIAELRGDLATKGTYSSDPVNYVQTATRDPKSSPAIGQPRSCSVATLRPGHGLPKDPTPNSVSSSPARTSGGLEADVMHGFIQNHIITFNGACLFLDRAFISDKLWFAFLHFVDTVVDASVAEMGQFPVLVLVYFLNAIVFLCILAI